MNTFLKDWSVAMFVYLAYAIVNKLLKIDITLAHSMLMGVSIVIIYRLSVIYDMLKQRQCCK